MKRKLALTLAALLAFALLAACDSGGPASKKDTLIMGTGVDVGTFMPSERTSSGDTNAQGVIFMNLVYVSYPEAVVKSEACTEWSGSDDAKTYTFKIKDGIKFHNGETLSAQDVVYSIEQCKITPSQEGWASNIESVTATDDNTVVLNLLQPNVDFLRICQIPLLHQATTEAAGEGFRTAPIGCGPYKLVSHEAGYQITYKAFDDYIMGKPYFDNLIFRVISDSSAALMALEAGELDGIASFTFTEIDNIKANDKLAIYSGSLGVDALVMNHNIAPFDDLNVRLAINYAIDKQRCSDAMYEGLSPFAASHISVVQDERLKGYPTDKEKAKEYLAAAGYPNGEGFPKMVIETIDVYSNLAQVIQSNLADIGINCELQISEANSYISRMSVGEVPLGVMSYGLGKNPSDYTLMFTSGAPYNFTGYANPELDALFAQAAQEMDDTARHNLYVEACLILERDAVYAPTSYQQIMYVYNSSLQVDEWGEAALLPQYTKMK